MRPTISATLRRSTCETGHRHQCRLDLLLSRTPFADAASAVFIQIEQGLHTACICATTVTTIHYLIYKSVGDKPARQLIGQLLRLLEVAPSSGRS